MCSELMHSKDIKQSIGDGLKKEQQIRVGQAQMCNKNWTQRRSGASFVPMRVAHGCKVFTVQCILYKKGIMKFLIRQNTGLKHFHIGFILRPVLSKEANCIHILQHCGDTQCPLSSEIRLITCFRNNPSTSQQDVAFLAVSSRVTSWSIFVFFQLCIMVDGQTGWCCILQCRWFDP